MTSSSPCDVITSFTANKCSQPPQIQNADLLMTSSPRIVQYKCHRGFWFTFGIFTAISRCEDDDVTWSPDPLTLSCHIIDCGHPPYIANTNYVINATTYDHQIHVTCLPGFRFADDVIIVTMRCDARGLWQPPTVTCVGTSF